MVGKTHFDREVGGWKDKVVPYGTGEKSFVSLAFQGKKLVDTHNMVETGALAARRVRPRYFRWSRERKLFNDELDSAKLPLASGQEAMSGAATGTCG